MTTTTQFLRLVGTILLILGVVYRASGWRAFWQMAKQPLSMANSAPPDPRYCWATPLAVLGLALSLLGSW